MKVCVVSRNTLPANGTIRWRTTSPRASDLEKLASWWTVTPSSRALMGTGFRRRKPHTFHRLQIAAVSRFRIILLSANFKYICESGSNLNFSLLSSFQRAVKKRLRASFTDLFYCWNIETVWWLVVFIITFYGQWGAAAERQEEQLKGNNTRPVL